MIKYLCPICKKRICDSEKELHLAGLNNNDSQEADMLIKCRNCKNTITVQVARVVEEIMPHEKTLF